MKTVIQVINAKIESLIYIREYMVKYNVNTIKVSFESYVDDGDENFYINHIKINDIDSYDDDDDIITNYNNLSTQKENEDLFNSIYHSLYTSDEHEIIYDRALLLQTPLNFIPG